MNSNIDCKYLCVILLLSQLHLILEITSKPITNTVKTNTRPRRQKYSMYVNHKSVSHTKSDLPTLKWLL